MKARRVHTVSGALYLYRDCDSFLRPLRVISRRLGSDEPPARPFPDDKVRFSHEQDSRLRDMDYGHAVLSQHDPAEIGGSG